jgi:Ni,Fe-hydrogenase III large subunit
VTTRKINSVASRKIHTFCYVLARENVNGVASQRSNVCQATAIDNVNGVAFFQVINV